MDRRNFIQTSIAGGLMAPPILGPTSALANNYRTENGGEGSEQTDARVRLKLVTSLVVLTWFLIVHQQKVFGIDLRQSVPTSPLSRADLSGAGALSGLFALTIPQQFAGANLFGSLYVESAILILLVTTSAFKLPKRSYIANNKTSYELKKRPKPVRSTQDYAAAVSRRRPDGSAVINSNNELLAIIPPSLVDKNFLK